MSSLTAGHPTLSSGPTGRARRPVPAALFLVLLAAACGPKAEQAQRPAPDTTTVAAVPDPTPAAAGHDMAGMSMTGDADRDFLRMMTDHHKGLIAMAHESMEKGRGTTQSRADAGRLDGKQDREIEQMVKMLDANYHDPYEPKVPPADQAVVDSLQMHSGPAYAAEFYRRVVAHHRRAIAMVDEYLPKAVRADVKAMADKMKKDQMAEVQEFERKAGTASKGQ